MSVIIELPSKKESDGMRVSNGTKVFLADGTEIEGVTGVNVEINPDSIIEAVIRIPVIKIVDFS